MATPSRCPLRELEIVGHQKVLRRVTADEPGQSSAEITLDFELPVDHGLWIAARCRAGEQQVAHTTPVYVRVDGGGFDNPDTAGHYLDLSERYLQELEREMERRSDDVSRQAWRYRDGLAVRIAETREVIDELRARFPKPPNPDPGALAALPTLRDGWHLAGGGPRPGGRGRLRGGPRARPDPQSVRRGLDHPVPERGPPRTPGRGAGGL